jgi:hypothetical protein
LALCQLRLISAYIANPKGFAFSFALIELSK